MRRALLAAYDADRRDLPWRGEEDPYRIWVSEVMLQQTRVETVIPYYRRWLDRFPDLEALASAPVDDVLMVWQGLGYYRRARALHAGARVVRERHGGTVPADPAALRELPGVGAYTAGAVASIAYGRVVEAVDGNVTRVLARLADVPRPPARWLEGAARALVDPERPGDWNQALMELGATVCTPRSPRCGGCPLAPWCAARAAGTQEERPGPGPRRTAPWEHQATAVVVDRRRRGLVVRRPEGGLLGGLWAFPGAPLEGGAPPAGGVDRGGGGDPGSEALLEAARQAAGAAGAILAAGAPPTSGSGRGRAAAPPTPDPAVLAPVAHRFTHRAVRYHAVVLAGEAEEAENRRWIPLEGPWPVPLPVAQQKIARRAAAVVASWPLRERGRRGVGRGGPPEP